MRTRLILILVVVIIAVVIVVLILLKSSADRKSALSSTSNSASPSRSNHSKTGGKGSKSITVEDILKRRPVGTSAPSLVRNSNDPDPLIPRLNPPDAKYAIYLPPSLDSYRSRIFHTHIDDIIIPDDLKTDPNYPKIVAALQTYDQAPTIEELRFLLKYKRFLDMPGVYSMCSPRDIDQLYMVLLNVIANKVPGDFIETGVWRGGICMMAKAIFNYYASNTTGIKDDLPRRVLLFDVFDQFPAPEPVVSDSTTGDSIINEKDSRIHDITRMMYDKPANAVEVRDAFRSLGLLDDNVSLVKGRFSDTLPAAVNSGLIASEGTSIAVLRIDNDYYDSVYYVLNQLYHKISPGGYVLIDDFNNPVVGCKEAVLRFRDENNINIPIVDSYGGSVYWNV